MAVTPEEQKNARRKAMLLLEHMDRTEKGLSDRLRQAGFSPRSGQAGAAPAQAKAAPSDTTGHRGPQYPCSARQRPSANTGGLVTIIGANLPTTAFLAPSILLIKVK